MKKDTLSKYKHDFFTVKGVDISSTKSMWNYLHDHPIYYTSTYGNAHSIANCVTIHNLGLEGLSTTALDFLSREKYDTIFTLLRDWENAHPKYVVFFNNDYLILCGKNMTYNILPSGIFGYITYEQCVKDLHYYGGTIAEHKDTLRKYTQLVRDFDELCNNCRDYANFLSKMAA